MDLNEKYRENCKPKLQALLESLQLNTSFSSAKGTLLVEDSGREIVDFVGGFGAVILGHNPTELVETAVLSLQKNVPINAQGSIRGESAKLAEKLNSHVPSDANYYVSFSNTGTESVEAAIKHAYKVRFDKIRREYDKITRLLNDFFYAYDKHGHDLALPGKNDNLIDFRDDLDEYNLEQFELFQNNPVLIAFKGAFHGKTVSSLKVTFNKSYRESFEGLSAIKPVYISPDDPERINDIIEENQCIFYYPVIINNKVELRPVSLTRVMGFIFEIVMGEGGILPVPERTLGYLAKNHKRLGVPFIIDEIQTGCGRTGYLFAYEQTPIRDISPEYIVLSKALGGGIAKIGATMIRNDIYDEDFGILHTSTFGEDDFSAIIACKVIDMLTENKQERLNEVREKGEYLMSRLRELKDKYPAIIKDVRGRGLMIGVEFTHLTERSPFFRAAGRQGVLSLLISSYLLKHHGIRVLAPLTTMLKGNPGKKRMSILRIQPPLSIEYGQLDSFILALDEVINIIESNNEFCLIAHLINQDLTEAERISPKVFDVKWPVVEWHQHIDGRTAFVVHPTELKHIVEYYFPSFYDYQWEDKDILNWWNGVSRFLEPVHVKSSYITSNDYVQENSMVFIPYLPKYMMENKNKKIDQEIKDKIQDAIIVAKELGDDNIPVTMVGLGAYTSIATQNGITLNDFEIPITTGNAYTTAVSIMGVMHQADARGIDLASCTLGVVGAAGNIGLVMSEIFALKVGRLKLIGRESSSSMLRMNVIREKCFEEILRVIQSEMQREIPFSATRLAGFSREIRRLLEQADGSNGDSDFHSIKLALIASEETDRLSARLGEAVDRYCQANGVSWIEAVNGLDCLQECDVVIASTNSDDPELIRPELVKPGALVACCSVPSNLSESFLGNDKNILAFDAGLAKLPENSVINFVGMPGGELTYGCLAETLILGFDGQNHSFSKGALITQKVYDIYELGERHEFSFGDLRLHNKKIEEVCQC